MGSARRLAAAAASDHETLRSGPAAAAAAEEVSRARELCDVALLCVTGSAQCDLQRLSDSGLCAAISSGGQGGGSSGDAELLGAIPTRSIVAQESVANAIVSAVVAERGMTAQQFKVNHPGGAIGEHSL